MRCELRSLRPKGSIAKRLDAVSVSRCTYLLFWKSAAVAVAAPTSLLSFQMAVSAMRSKNSSNTCMFGWSLFSGRERCV
ncbi:hypothetical protein GQ42DRAFT_68291 [Ramicandelaber brevisporus]|nr:hypothetical protein GQ42DRAFT_68291 [Ramicandelaber brevisporus]